MKIRNSIAAAAAAATVALGTAGALAGPALASPHCASHTLKFTTVTASVTLTKISGAIEGTDVNSKGKTIGYNVGYEVITGRTSATLSAATAVTGGLLYVTAATTDLGKTYNGRVTGGTGAFKGATGTVSAKRITGQKLAVTIIYS
jgi:hypothetical protein